VVGAIKAVAAHPTDSNILYVGGINGGIWRTTNAKAATPHWTPLTDDLPSLSISSLAFDPTDPTHRTLVACIGRYSSFRFIGGPDTGILRTTDGGDNWTQINLNHNISAIAARGATLLGADDNGVIRSVDGGINFVALAGIGSSGLPLAIVSDLVSDPGNLNRFYVALDRTGIFRSDDGGATWTNISSGDPTLNAIITQDDAFTAKLAVASTGRLYVVVATSGRAQYIGFTDNPSVATPAWTPMDLPGTPGANGEIEGVNPGGQGNLHLSIVVDRNDPNTVYVGGDSQDLPFPNFIGALTFSGRLFRGDTTVAPTGMVPSPQWKHLTHSNSIQQIPGGGTASGSAPHAGSREMVIDASGDLIEVDEGGVYRRTSPRDNTGDWFSINGDIQTTEFIHVAYDTNSNIIIGAAQSVGISQQLTTGSTTWTSVSVGDGSDVAVDNITLAASNQSIRYSNSQIDLNFRREVYDAANNRVGDPVFPALTVVGGGAPLQPIFINSVALNAINPTRLVIAGFNSVYESFDQGDTITDLGSPGDDGAAIAYGGKSGGVVNPDVLYVGINTNANPSIPVVFLRTMAGAHLTQTAALPTSSPLGIFLHDLVIDPNDWRSAYVVVDNQVFRTTDAGVSWTDITGNLTQLGAGDFKTVVFVAGATNSLLLVGTNAGVFVSSSSSSFTIWNKLGIGLPNAPVMDLDYDVKGDVLVAGTLGRGAWTITNLRGLTGPTAAP
jgi:photosystem II stability/assembly factor-like uncharacterized protein